MSKKIFFTIILTALMLNLAMVAQVNAQPAPIYEDVIEDQLTSLQQGTGLPGGDTPGQTPVDIVAKVIKGVLGLLAMLFLIMIIIAGFRWMTSDGNSEIVDKSKYTIQNAVIGVIVIFFAYAITAFIFRIVLTANF